MATDRDNEQDAMIRQNAEKIRRHDEEILKQTACLEKIRDHYFPKRSLWKRALCFILKCAGAVTVAAGILESAEWYWNERESDAMAAKSAAVARRLFFTESDVDGAVRFLEKAVVLDGDTMRYRVGLAYMKGIAVVMDLAALERPLTPDERARVDAVLAEAVFLMETDNDEPMPYVLAAHAYLLRGETEEARRAIGEAIARGGDRAIIRANASGISFMLKDVAAAKSHVAEAERIDPNLPLVHYWKGMLAFAADGDHAAAKHEFSEMVRLAPRLSLGHAELGRMLMLDAKPDYSGARAEFELALKLSPKLTLAMMYAAESYDREGDIVLARIWCDRALSTDGNCMSALQMRAHLAVKAGVNAGAMRSAADDLTHAIELAPFRSDLYRMRALVYSAAGDPDSEAKDVDMANRLETFVRR